MKITDLSLAPMKRAIADLGPTFTTLDVIEHDEMAESRKRFAGEPMFHALVGKQIKQRMGFWGLTEVAAGTARGSVWTRR